jgi:Protein of unknown function (DUF2785)
MNRHNLTELATQKDFLQALIADDYRLLADYDPCLLLKALLPALGSNDGYVRDKLVYPIMAQIILADFATYPLTGAQREELLLTCIDRDHLFSHIGDVGTDSVFMRAFSSLIVAAILFKDHQHPHISEEVAGRVTQAMLAYAKQERDYRGYLMGGKGWAHSIAHLADALDECAKNRYTTAAGYTAILETLTYLAGLPEPLGYGEDERLAFVALGIIARQSVDLASLKTWIASLAIVREGDVLEDEGVTSYIRALNARNFLRSLYFLLQWNNVSAIAEQNVELQAELDQALKRLNELSGQ